MEQNTELGLNLRLLAGAAGGKDLLRTNTNIVTTDIGAQFTREWTEIDKSGKFHLEAKIGGRYSKFQYSDPEIDLTTNLEIYPSISQWGRIRINFDVKLKWEIIEDLYWSLTFYDNFDNKPQGVNAHKNDYGVVLAFGWSY